MNTVVGFIGPEYLYDGKQILRAGLEDHFCGKLMGLPMGCDVCYTNHAEADQDDMDALLTMRSGIGRRNAQLPEYVVPRRALSAGGAGASPGAGVRGLAAGYPRASVGPNSLRQTMRALLAFLALLGLAGIVVGVLTILRHVSGPGGVPFSYENYGGPGPIIAGVLVLAVSLYLLSIWPSRD